MKTLKVLFFATIALSACGLSAFGQSAQPAATAASFDKEIALMRTDLRSEKKKVVAMNVPLTADEATKFWPVYDQYVAEMTKNNNEFYDIVLQYSKNQKTWTDAECAKMLDRWSQYLVEQAKMRQKYVPLIEKVIPARKAALFFQIDRRLYLLMDLQITSYLPLIVQQN